MRFSFLVAGALVVVGAAGACGASSRPSSATSAGGAGGQTSSTSIASSSSGASTSDASSSSGATGGAGGGTSACAPMTAWAQGFQAQRETVVATTGDDAAGDGSMAKPWKSVAHALQVAKPGDHVTVKAGTYDCASSFVDGSKGAQGTMDHPIWVTAEKGAVIDCGDPTTGSATGLMMTGVSYVVIEGLEIRNAGGHALHVDGHSTGVLLKSVFLHRAGLACVKASQSDGVSIEDSELADAGLTSDANASAASGQILDNVGVHGAHVVRTKIHGALGNANGSGANVAVQYKGGSHDIDIAQNDIWDAGTAVNLGGSTGPMYFDPQSADYEGKNVFAWANTVKGQMHVAFAAVGCHACAITNNTVYAPLDAQAIRALPGSDPKGGTSHTTGFEVKNNLFVFAGGVPQDLFNAAQGETMGITQASNLFYAAGQMIGTIYSDVPVAGAAGVIVDQDPKLVAPPDDLHLGPMSPAIGAGTALPTRTADRDSTCRTTWDIGAYAAH